MRGKVWLNRKRVYLYIGYGKNEQANMVDFNHKKIGYHTWYIDIIWRGRNMFITLRLGDKANLKFDKLR